MSNLSLSLAACLLAAPEPYPNSSLLVEPADLAKPPAAGYRILDVRPKAQYLEGHIPGAVWADASAWGEAVGDRPDPAAWAERLAAAGIDPAKPVVVYAASVPEAARAWWLLKHAGVADVRLLNGGWPGWVASGGKVEKKENRPEALAGLKTVPRRERLATREDVLARLKDRSAQILDARSAGEYSGRTRSAKRPGHIPGAIRIEWTELIDPKTQRFKSADELKKLFADRKVDPGRPSVTYCQSGARSAVLGFGLELMGAKEVRNYYRSWAEWGNAADTPVEK